MIDIVEAVKKHKESKIRRYQCTSNRASSLGHPCIRYLVYCRTHWEQAVLHDIRLQMLFDEGNNQEEIVKRDLREAGIKIAWDNGKPFEYKEYQITGTLDGGIVEQTEAGRPGRIIPFECKKVSTYKFGKLNTIEDMLNDKWYRTRMYPQQLNIYLLMVGEENGFFILKNADTGEIKQIPMALDYDMGESLLNKAKTINSHIAEKTTPDRIEYDEQVCSECSFKHICCPNEVFKAAEIIEGELVELLDRRETLDPQRKEYEEIDDKIKEMIKEKSQVLAGKWIITGKFIEAKRLNSKAIPQEIKDKYTETKQEWRSKIQKL